MLIALFLLGATTTPAIAADTDGDGVDDATDNCTVTANPAQTDTDLDGIGNACDPDFDGDCTVDTADLDLLMAAFATSDPLYDLDGDTFVLGPDASILDSYSGGPPGENAIGQCHQGDTDGDGIDDSVDNCTDAPNPGQLDGDGDGIGNACDADFDNDCDVDDDDWTLLQAAYGGSDPTYDLDQPPDGQVLASDFSVFAGLYGNPPGRNASFTCASTFHSRDAASPGLATIGLATNGSSVFATPAAGPDGPAIRSNELGLRGSPYDELDAMTAGGPVGGGIYYSVDRASVGALGTVVADEAGYGQAAGDVYLVAPWPGFGIPSLAYNQDELGAEPGIAAGQSATPPIDDVDAFDLAVGPPFDATQEPVLIALAAGHLYVGASGQTGCGGDLFQPTPAGPPIPVIAYSDLGLQSCSDDVDALHMDDATGDLYFSLTTGSPALTSLLQIAGCPPIVGCGGADVFLRSSALGTTSVAFTSVELGLDPDDELDALRLVPEPAAIAQLAAGAALLPLLALRRRQRVFQYTRK